MRLYGEGLDEAVWGGLDGEGLDEAVWGGVE